MGLRRNPGSLIMFVLLCSPVLAIMEPEFTEPVPNVTVPVGREAVLSCVVNHLSKHKVAWVKVDTQTILTIHHHVITRNYRINLKHSDHRNWYLHINNVQESDRGFYMCQINTVPMKSQMGFLEVVVSPEILDNQTSSDMVVREGANVSLTCRASGYPTPFIIWKREDGQMISLTGQYDVVTVDGEDLNITRVSRLHMGAYLCIASNGVPPSVSKRVELKVHFPPMIWIPNQLVGGLNGGDVGLECHTEAYPKSINYWTTEKGEMITSGDKYTAITVGSSYQVHMKLKIHYLEEDDFGSYRCIAKNSLGETDGSIKLYEIPSPTPSTQTTTDRLNLESHDHLGENRISTGGRRPEPLSENDRKLYKGIKTDSTKDPTQPDNSIYTHHRPQADEVSDSASEISPVLGCVVLVALCTVVGITYV